MRRAASAVRCALRYLALRRELARRFARSPLDELLRSIPWRRAPAPASLSTLRLGVQLAERGGALFLRDTNTCLYRALARSALLVENGHAATFVMGAPRADTAGHAWVELDGVAFLEPGAPAFVRTLSHAWLGDALAR